MTAFRAPYDEALGQLTTSGSAFELGQRTYNGIDYQCYVNAPASLIELLNVGRNHGSGTFLVYADQRWSFDEFFAAADALAEQLQSHFKISKGKRVAIAMRNYPEWLMSYVAIANLGAVVVPLNSWQQGPELRNNLSDAKIDLLIADRERMTAIDPSELAMPGLLVRAEDQALPEGWQHFASALEAGRGASRPEVEVDSEDLAMILFTSGTSGRAKGAMFSHRNCCQAIVNFEATGAACYMCNLDAYARHGERNLPAMSLLAVPLFHVSGLLAQFILSLRVGRGLVMMYKWDTEQACELIQREQVSVVVGAPSMVIDLMEEPAFKALEADNLINVSGGGAAVPSKFVDLMQKRLPNSLTGSGWGMTETSATGSSFNGYFFYEKPKASGFVAPIVELQFFAEDGTPVAQGERGEIWLKSPTVVQGYCNADEANASEFRDGWFKTGDIGYVDEDGCVIICDRAKDMVIRGGENIYPVEVENCIQSIPGVDRVAAFAIPSERWGEELAAVVQLRPEATLSAADVQAHCKAALAAFKVPSVVELTTEPLPMNATKKILKRQLRDDFIQRRQQAGGA